MAGKIETPADLGFVVNAYIGCLNSIKGQARAHNFHSAYRAVLDLEKDLVRDLAEMKNYLASKGALR